MLFLLLCLEIAFERLIFKNIEIQILASFLGGFLIFGLSFFFTTAKPLCHWQLLMKYAVQSMRSLYFLKQVSIQGLTALWEELFWRVLVQGFLLLGLPSFWALLVTALLFWSGHTHCFYGTKIRALELLLFSLFLGLLFELTQAYILCCGIHFVRNMMVVVYQLAYKHFSFYKHNESR